MTLLSVILAITLPAPEAAAQTNTVLNSAFETPVLASGAYQYNPSGASWTFSSGSGIQKNGSAWSAAAAPEGQQTAFLQNISQIAQTINFTAGSYTVSFYAARRGSQVQPIQVSIDGAAVGSPIIPASSSFALYKTSAFTVTSGNRALQFNTFDASGDNSSFIDAVVLNTVTNQQTIAFGALANQTLGAAPFTISATASSGLAVSFASSTTAVCTVSGSTVTLVAVGTCTIRAAQAGNANYSAAPNVNQSFQVTAAGANDMVWVEDALPAGATMAADGGDSWNWISSNPLPYSGALAHQAVVVSAEHQHYFYNATATLNVGIGDSLFSYVYLDPANPPSEVMLQWNDGVWEHRAYWGANLIPFGNDGTVARHAMGLLPALGQWVRLEVAASVVGLEGHVLNGMAFTLYGGRATWDRAGKSSSATLTSQTITFNALANQGLGAAPFTASATASSGLPVTFASLTSAVCTISGSTVTLVSAGTCTIQASQAGNATYAAAPNVNQSFVVTNALLSQTITFGALSNQTFGAAPFTVSATASSGLPVSFASLTTPVCTVTGSTVTLVGAGTCTIRASQAGNATYSAAPNVDQSFSVTPATTGQSQILYLYDAAGNLIQMTRSVASPKPDLTVTNLSVGTITLNANNSFNIPVTFQVNNIGTSAAVATWYDRGYLSANSTLHDIDQALGGFNTRTVNLAVGSSYTVTTTFTTSTITAPGTYTLIVKADGGANASGQYSPTGTNYVAEFDETNNTRSVQITLAVLPPDLTVTNASVGAVAVNQNGSYSFPATYTVTNSGGSSAAPNWFDLAYLSTDAVLDNSDQNLSGYHVQSTALAAGASYTVTTTFTTTTTTAGGSYTLFIKADGHGAAATGGTNTDNGYVAESNEANNTQSVALTLASRPDLTVSNASVGAVTISQSGSYSIPVTYTVTNSGGSSAAPNWFDLAYLSTDAVLDNSDQNLSGYHTQSTALAAGASYTVTTTFTTTTATAAGSYTLFIKADGKGPTSTGGTNTDNGYVAESNEANNTQALAVTLPVKPDLTVTNVSVGTIVKNANHSYTIPVTYTINNVGGAPAQPNWYDQAYLSTDGVLDNSDQNLSNYNYRATALAAGSSYTVTTTFTTTTTTAAGNYTLFIKADGKGPTNSGGTNTDNGYVAESNEANNSASISTVLP